MFWYWKDYTLVTWGTSISSSNQHRWEETLQAPPSQKTQTIISGREI